MKILLLASASFLLAAGAAVAQDTKVPGEKPAVAASASSVTDAETAAVATISAEAKKLQEAAAPGLAAAKTPEDKRKAQYALDDQMEALFKANSITFDRYNAVAGQAQTDKALAARIAAAPKTPFTPTPSAPASASPASATVPDPALEPGKGAAPTGTAKPDVNASPAPVEQK